MPLSTSECMLSVSTIIWIMSISILYCRFVRDEFFCDFIKSLLIVLWIKSFFLRFMLAVQQLTVRMKHFSYKWQTVWPSEFHSFLITFTINPFISYTSNSHIFITSVKSTLMKRTTKFACNQRIQFIINIKVLVYFETALKSCNGVRVKSS